jgi:probable HAF family extracellular repeat protein
MIVCAGFLCGMTEIARGQCDAYLVEHFRTNHCGIFGYGFVRTSAISELGTIVGQFGDCNFIDRAFWWSGGPTVHALPNLPGLIRARGTDINVHQQIIGYHELNEPGIVYRGFVFASGTYTDLGSLLNSNTIEPLGINDLGQICGVANNSVTGPLRAFLWQNGTMGAIRLPRGHNSVANDINNHSQIVGWMGVAPGASFFAEPFLWQDGVAVGLGLPKGSLSGEAVAISDTGHIAGQHFVEVVPGYIRRRGFHWKDGVFTDLGVLPPHDSVHVGGINDHGEIVGYCYTQSGGSTLPAPFIWRDGVMKDLRPLVPLPANIELFYAHDINNLGQIAASGRDTSNSQNTHSPGFRLTPSSTIPGDLDRNCAVDIHDLLGVISQWGPVPGGGRHPADLTRDGIVNVADLLVVINHWHPG